jgi:hypothetical protein
MGYKQTREFMYPTLKQYNDHRAVLRIFPMRPADQDREHELIIARAEIPDLITGLQRALDYESPYRRHEANPED